MDHLCVSKSKTNTDRRSPAPMWEPDTRVMLVSDTEQHAPYVENVGGVE